MSEAISGDANHQREEARRWVRRKRIFYTVVGIYLCLSLMWFAIDLLDDSSGYWFYWPMLGTGLGVVVTGVVLGGIGRLFGADWERRQVERYIGQQGDSQVGPMLGSNGGGQGSMPPCIAKEVTRPIRNREAPVTEPYLA